MNGRPNLQRITVNSGLTGLRMPWSTNEWEMIGKFGGGSPDQTFRI